jgi:hypothetical protein
MTSNSGPSSDQTNWEAGWEGHEMAQLKRFAKLSFEQKIRWLESAQEMAARLQRSRSQTRPTPPAPPPADEPV